MFLSMQSLNGDSYQGAQVGANVQSQVGPTNEDSSWQLVRRAVLVLPVYWAIHSAVWSTLSQKNKREKIRTILCSCKGSSNYQARASNNIRLTQVFADYFALDGIFWHPKYDPTPLLSCHEAISWLQTSCECIWLWLGLLGLYWVFFGPSLFCTLYRCLILLLSSTSTHFVSSTLLYNQHSPRKLLPKISACLKEGRILGTSIFFVLFLFIFLD